VNQREGASPVTVDPVTGALRLGARGLPLELDVRAGVARVRLGEVTYTARPMVWRDKQILARFAELGPAFLRRQVLSLCLEQGTALPEGEADLQDLLELVLWVQRPRSGQPVLLEPGALAAVTLGVCRALGVPPADLDDREAPEVEALWQAAQSQSAGPAGPKPALSVASKRGMAAPADEPGVRRILVVPDPPGRARASSTTADPRCPSPGNDEPAKPAPASAAPETVDIVPVEAVPSPETVGFAPVETAQSQETVGLAPAEAVPSPAAVGIAPAARSPRVERVATVGSHRAAPKAVRRFRPVAWQPGAPRAATLQAPGCEVERAAGVMPATESEPALANPGEPLSAVSPLLFHAPVAAPLSRSGPRPAPSAPASSGAWPVAASAVDCPAPAGPAPVPAPIRLDEDETRRLFDEWTRRLAESVDELGLDEEG
jgi:hypothetical protein